MSTSNPQTESPLSSSPSQVPPSPIPPNSARWIDRLKPTRSDLATWIAAAVLCYVAGYYTFHATLRSAFMLGWLVGASKSPMGTSAAAAIFALAQGLIIAATWKAADWQESNPARTFAIRCIAVIAFSILTIYFIEEMKRGIGEGVQVKIADEKGYPPVETRSMPKADYIPFPPPRKGWLPPYATPGAEEIPEPPANDNGWLPEFRIGN